MTKKDQHELNYENPNLQLETFEWFNVDDEEGKEELLSQIRKDLRIPDTNLLRKDYKIYWEKNLVWIRPR